MPVHEIVHQTLLAFAIVLSVSVIGALGFMTEQRHQERLAKLELKK